MVEVAYLPNRYACRVTWEPGTGDAYHEVVNVVVHNWVSMAMMTMGPSDDNDDDDDDAGLSTIYVCTTWTKSCSSVVSK